MRSWGVPWAWAQRLKNVLGLPERFRQSEFQWRERWREDYEVLAASLLHRLDFESAFDVGCANGFLLSSFLAAERRVGGIELSPAVLAVLPPPLRDVVTIGDFRQARGTWDLVCCVEVAEHIPRRRSAELVEVVTDLAQRWIYFTAAPPGQPGYGHINCRPRADWTDLFRASGWREAEEMTRAVQTDLESQRETWWLSANSMVLQKLRG